MKSCGPPNKSKKNLSKIFNKKSHLIFALSIDILWEGCAWQFLMNFFFYKDTGNSLYTTNLDLYFVIVFAIAENPISIKYVFFLSKVTAFSLPLRLQQILRSQTKMKFFKLLQFALNFHWYPWDVVANVRDYDQEVNSFDLYSDNKSFRATGAHF